MRSDHLIDKCNLDKIYYQNYVFSTKLALIIFYSEKSQTPGNDKNIQLFVKVVSEMACNHKKNFIMSNINSISSYH